MARENGGLVSKVEPGSLGEYIGIQPYDKILAISGHRLRDELDFRFYATEEHVTMEVLKKEGKTELFELEKDPDDLMGITFFDPLFDGVKLCQNNCVFCFLKQLPRGMRPGLYVRDDDYRLSFLYGNFITLTNLSDEDYARIEEQRLSPLRVSVHTTDGSLRERLMGSKKAGAIMEHLERLTSSGIDLHIQIVLLKGVNDGRVLERTLEDLMTLGDRVVSVGVVPAVYTRYRRYLPSPPLDAAWAREVLEIIEGYGGMCRKTRGKTWVYGADEFYLISGRDFPGAQEYDGFPQYENGIGMVADLREEVEKFPRAKLYGVSGADEGGVSLAVTGKMAYSEVLRSIRKLGLEDRVFLIPIENTFFGPSVTCAGLLTGQDILSGVLSYMREKRRTRGRSTLKGDVSRLLVPEVAVSEGRFLDDLTVEDLSQILGLPVVVTGTTPAGLVTALSSKGELP